ncbi:DUF86 domain-containing protein [Conchiformibius steedae DSM 2580]|uniref:DUF86 domain-containing protein n=1 Tax=Conchiformibius steedae DSM 2580 TaxID=1121352 RepID=A0AAE9HY08_9NEIS|nr:HepT-like ribonuclease domain-containing protein [Conchiformibius steedae]QMT34434.1 DUF86 domain-containing protein [Conchiformibius steedae]URD67216.1 DUF86 domain-containing protein [Conchiformibius steedae DSM 2580]
MNERTPDYLQRMYGLCEDIQSFIEGMALDDFLNDKRTQNAVAMSLLALGEVANTIHQKDAEFIENNPQIEWKPMRGMRNVIAHGYFELDFVVIYETANQLIPLLKNQLAALIEQFGNHFQAA